MPLDTYANLQKSVLDWLARPDDPLVQPVVPDLIVLWEEEARDRFKTRFQEHTTTLTPTPGFNTIPLPLDYVQMREMWVDTNTGRRVFQYHPPRNLDQNFFYYASPGYPVAYTIEGLNIRMTGSLWGEDAPPVVVSDSCVSVGDVPPPNPQQGDLWWYSGEAGGSANLFIWYVDPTSAQWVEANTVPPYPPATTDPAPMEINITYMAGLPALSNAVPTNWLLTNYPSAYLWGTLSLAEPYIGDDPRIAIWMAAREQVIERIKLADRKARYPEGLMIQTDVKNPP